MKRLLPVLVLLVFFLGACTGRGSVTPSTPSSDENLVKTSVAKTLTALPSQTPVVMVATPAGGVLDTPVPPPAATETFTSTPMPPTATARVIYVYPTPVTNPPSIVYHNEAP